MTDDQDAAARQAAELLPCLYPGFKDTGCPPNSIPCYHCSCRPAVAAALREGNERKCKPDAGRHYNYAGAAECECKLFVRELHVRERIAACTKRVEELEAELERAKSSKPNWQGTMAANARREEAVSPDETLREIMLGPHKPFVTRKGANYTARVARAFAKAQLQEVLSILVRHRFHDGIVGGHQGAQWRNAVLDMVTDEVATLAAKLDGGEK